MFLNIGQVFYWNYNVCFISNVECNLTEVKGFRFNDLSSVIPVLYGRHVALIWLSNVTQLGL
jgi:hypothetical protein